MVPDLAGLCPHARLLGILRKEILRYVRMTAFSKR